MNCEKAAIDRNLHLMGEYIAASQANEADIICFPEMSITGNQFVAHNGKLLGYYRKKTIKDEEADWFAPGDQQPTFSVSGLTFGLSVCADIDDPKIFGEYAQKGSAIVFESAASGLYGEQETRNWSSGFNWWRSNCMAKLGKYAAEESLFIGVATQAGRTIDEDFPGGGYLFDPTGGMYG